MNKEHKPNSAPAWPQRLFLAFLPLAAIFVLAFVLVQPAAAAREVNTDIPISGTVVNPCNGENVTFSGVDHFTAHLTIGTSGSFHLDQHDNVHVTAVGDQGNTYVGNQEDSLVVNGKVGVEETSGLTFSEISQGSAPNFELHQLLHLTVNANGTVTVFVDHFTSTCQG